MPTCPCCTEDRQLGQHYGGRVMFCQKCSEAFKKACVDKKVAERKHNTKKDKKEKDFNEALCKSKNRRESCKSCFLKFCVRTLGLNPELFPEFGNFVQPSDPDQLLVGSVIDLTLDDNTVQRAILTKAYKDCPPVFKAHFVDGRPQNCVTQHPKQALYGLFKFDQEYTVMVQSFFGESLRSLMSEKPVDHLVPIRTVHLIAYDLIIQLQLLHETYAHLTRSNGKSDVERLFRLIDRLDHDRLERKHRLRPYFKQWLESPKAKNFD